VKRYILLILILILIFSLSCTGKPINRYECKDFEQWASPQCNPPICLEIRICTYDLYPQRYWNSVELQIFPVAFKRARVQEWIERGGVEGLSLKQYIEGQNLRYIEALNSGNQQLIQDLIVDADRVGYYLIPSKFMGGS